MIPQFNAVYNWLAQGQQTWHRLRSALSALPLDRPNLAQLARHPEQLPHLVTECAVAQRYLKLLGPLDWDHFPERDPHYPWPGSPPLPRAPFVAAYLVKLDQQRRYMADLRTYLVEHPALVWILGFPLSPSPAFAWGFDPEASVPDQRLFLTVLRTLDNAVLQFLLDNTVQILGQELPADCNFGQTIALDTKHIIAWVRASCHGCLHRLRRDWRLFAAPPRSPPSATKETALSTQHRGKAGNREKLGIPKPCKT